MEVMRADQSAQDAAPLPHLEADLGQLAQPEAAGLFGDVGRVLVEKVDEPAERSVVDGYDADQKTAGGEMCVDRAQRAVEVGEVLEHVPRHHDVRSRLSFEGLDRADVQALEAG